MKVCICKSNSPISTLWNTNSFTSHGMKYFMSLTHPALAMLWNTNSSANHGMKYFIYIKSNSFTSHGPTLYKSDSPTSHGKKYFFIRPSICMSHGWTNMAQSYSSAACITTSARLQLCQRSAQRLLIYRADYIAIIANILYLTYITGNAKKLMHM